MTIYLTLCYYSRGLRHIQTRQNPNDHFPEMRQQFLAQAPLTLAMNDSKHVLEGGISCSYQCGKFLMCEHQIMSVQLSFFFFWERNSHARTELFCYHNTFCYVFTTTSGIQVHFNNTKCDIVELRHVQSVTFYFSCLLGITRTWTITKILLVGRVCFERTDTFFIRVRLSCDLPWCF